MLENFTLGNPGSHNSSAPVERLVRSLCQVSAREVPWVGLGRRSGPSKNKMLLYILTHRTPGSQNCSGTAGGCSPPNFWTPRVNLIKNQIFGILASRAIERYMYGSNWGRGGQGGSEFLGTPPQKFSSFEHLNIYLEPSAQDQSIGILSEKLVEMGGHFVQLKL